MRFLRLTGAMAGSDPRGGDLMKHGKKPTAAQRRLMEKRGLDSRVWLVVKDTPQNMELVHRHSDRTRRVLPKEVIRCAEQNPEGEHLHIGLD